ncbi:hypothetical protein Acr_24g0009840 [Actinidia rufa]|uniref:Uncharacterized protein n=1 Tax=Actinidia rufa TaxID=165716 RepID=A0A7J0GW98_9ERIC|nr:hypothetical protein Acr_24g0009840 [Actinidia rufa]
MALPMPTRGARGPIFEDGPNFEMAFKLFHGQDGVVPLSGRSFMHSEKLESERAPAQFNPLAAKAATISLSGFGAGGLFGFDAFSEKWKNQKKKSKSSKKGNSQGGDSKHEAMSNEWLTTGNCPIAKSYRAVSHVLPLVAKALQPPPGMKVKCPPSIVAARAALSRTAFAKNLRPQPPCKDSCDWSYGYGSKCSFRAVLRKSVLMPKSANGLHHCSICVGAGYWFSGRSDIVSKQLLQGKSSLTETSDNCLNPLQGVEVKAGHTAARLSSGTRFLCTLRARHHRLVFASKIVSAALIL